MESLHIATSWPLALYSGLILLIAYTVRGVVGFASALIAVPLLSLHLPLPLVVPVVSLLDYLASLTQGLQHRRLIRWREMLPLVPFTVAGVAAGLWLLARLGTSNLALALGLFISLYGLHALLPFPALRGSRRWAAPMGFLGGLVGAVFGTGGPFYVIYLRLRRFEKTEFRATVATIFMLDGGMRLLGYLGAGFYNWQSLWAIAAGLPLMAVGLWGGHRLHLGLSQRAFGRLVSAILVMSGIALILDNL